jgi:hypothetical protein
MGLIIALLIAIVVIVLVKYLLDFCGVPSPLNWIILLLIAIIALWQLWSRYGNVLS